MQGRVREIKERDEYRRGGGVSIIMRVGNMSRPMEQNLILGLIPPL